MWGGRGGGAYEGKGKIPGHAQRVGGMYSSDECFGLFRGSLIKPIILSNHKKP